MKRAQTTSIHASVGVIIAIVANTWMGRIIPPFIWALIWCARLALLPGKRQGSYAKEYVRAVLGSMALSIPLGALKALFRYALLGR